MDLIVHFYLFIFFTQDYFGFELTFMAHTTHLLYRYIASLNYETLWIESILYRYQHNYVWVKSCLESLFWCCAHFQSRIYLQITHF